MIIPLTRQSTSLISQTLQQRMRSSPSLTSKCQQFIASLAEQKNLAETWRQAASIYTNIRNNESVLVFHDQPSQCLDVLSTSNFFAANQLELTGEWTSCPLAKVINNDRKTIHVPNLKEDLFQYFDDQATLFEEYEYPFRWRVLPDDPFGKRPGALLITPLGLERSTLFGFGMIIEYQEQGPFDHASILEAQALATAFTYQMAIRYCKEIESLPPPNFPFAK